jgi:hypothetical protein
LIEQPKVKHIHRGRTLRYLFEHQLNNENQDCKIGTVFVSRAVGEGTLLVEGRRVKEGD